MAVDENMLAADCIVLCCCCQCLILQIVVFLLVKLPHKVLKRTKRYTKKFAAHKRAGSKLSQTIEMTKKYNQDDSFRNLGNSFRIDVKDLFLTEALQLGSIDEVENVLEELSCRGEFGFGSFWGGRDGEGDGSVLRRVRSCPEEIIDYDSIGFRLMELFGSSNLSSYH